MPNIEKFRNQTCCLTGHRDLIPGDEPKIKARLRYIIDDLIARDVKYFGVGGRIGFDMLAAEYLIERRQRNGKFKIISVLPYPGYMEKWPDDLKKRQETIIKKSDKVVYVAQEYSQDVYLKRDRHLVDGSKYCVAYCNKGKGGTAYTVRYAFEKGLILSNCCQWDLSVLRPKG